MLASRSRRRSTPVASGDETTLLAGAFPPQPAFGICTSVSSFCGPLRMMSLRSIQVSSSWCPSPSDSNGSSSWTASAEDEERSSQGFTAKTSQISSIADRRRSGRSAGFVANHFENVFLLREMRSLSWRRVSRCLLSTSSNLDQNEFRERVPHVVLSSIRTVQVWPLRCRHNDPGPAAGIRLGPDHDLHVLIEGGKKMHQSLHGKALQPVV